MTIRNLAALAALTSLAFPLAAHAQSGGAAAGATTGAVGGAIVGGPVGAVVGGVGGAIVGGLAVSKRSRSARFFRQVGSPTTRCPRNTAFAIIATQS